MMVTCAIDKTVAVWDTLNIDNNPNRKPIACGSKDMGVGKLYTVNFYPSSPWLLGCGGGDNQLALWDTSIEAAFQKRFGARLADTSKPADNAESEAKTEDFEAMMAAADKSAQTAREEAKSGSKKKKKAKGKKKGNRKR